MNRVLMTVQLPGRPSLAAARRKLGLRPDEVDESYGLVEIDPAQHLYALLVDADAAEDKGGGWANPRIEPFGPPV